MRASQQGVLSVLLCLACRVDTLQLSPPALGRQPILTSTAQQGVEAGTGSHITPVDRRQRDRSCLHAKPKNQQEAVQQLVKRWTDAAKNGKPVKKKRIRMSAKSEVDRMVTNVEGGAPFRDYMSLPVDQYITFDERVMTQTGVGAFTFKIPAKAPGMYVVADVKVDQNLKKRRNTWTGSNFGFAFDEAMTDNSTSGADDLQRYIELANIGGDNGVKNVTENAQSLNEATTEWIAQQPREKQQELLSVTERLLSRAIRFLDISAEGEAVLSWVEPGDSLPFGKRARKMPGPDQCLLRAELSVRAELSYGPPAPGWQLPQWLLQRLANLLTGAISTNLLTRAAMALEQDYRSYAAGKVRGGSLIE